MFRQLQKGREDFRRKMVSARSLQHVTDHQKPTVLHHVLLHRLRTLDKIANKPQQFRAEKFEKGVVKTSENNHLLYSTI